MKDLLLLAACIWQACARWMWNLGYDPSRLVALVNSCPPLVLAAARRLLAAGERLAQVATRSLAIGAAATAAIDAYGFGEPRGFDGWPTTRGEEAIWELETELGLVRIDFDAETQRRTRMVANSRAAQIWGFHREEYLARFAAHEGPCQLSDVAALCSFLVGMSEGRADYLVAYQRFSFGAGPSTRALLVRTCKMRGFDGLGRMVQVSCACAQATCGSLPAEFA